MGRERGVGKPRHFAAAWFSRALFASSGVFGIGLSIYQRAARLLSRFLCAFLGGRTVRAGSMVPPYPLPSGWVGPMESSGSRPEGRRRMRSDCEVPRLLLRQVALHGLHDACGDSLGSKVTACPPSPSRVRVVSCYLVLWLYTMIP